MAVYSRDVVVDTHDFDSFLFAREFPYSSVCVVYFLFHNPAGACVPFRGNDNNFLPINVYRTFLA